MYKKIILSVFILIFLFAGCTPVKENNSEPIEEEYVKAVWITYYELSGLTKDSDESTFKKSINKVFKELKSNGFNRVTVQVRPYADAFYKSDYFPVSSYVFGQQGSELIFDPLAIMVETAHKHNLKIEAWINPYRISNSKNFNELSEDNIAQKWKDTDNLIVCDSGIYFNPASKEVNDLIVNGVKEIVTNYEVDSICFDDYFYPETSEDIDKNSFKEYQNNKGELTLGDWRRENVNNMIKSVYSAIKKINKNVTFGISPASNIDNNYTSLYADVRKWSTEDGFVDYICPQIYFGFKNESQPFMKTTKNWIQMADCTLYIALPLYKAESEDEFAGDSGIKEFVENNDIIARQVNYISKLDSIKGYYVFSYSSLKDNEETKNLYSAMANSPQ